MTEETGRGKRSNMFEGKIPYSVEYLERKGFAILRPKRNEWGQTGKKSRIRRWRTKGVYFKGEGKKRNAGRD